MTLDLNGHAPSGMAPLQPTLILPPAPVAPVARLAARLAQAPMAAVVPADLTRRWQTYGIDGERATREGTEIRTLALGAEELLEVEDAQREAYLAQCPLVLGSFGVRYVAVAPLWTPEGIRAGALVVMDTHPRRLTDGERTMLCDLVGVINVAEAI